MANETNQSQVQLSPEFVAFLQQFPDLLTKFLEIIKAWYDIQQNPPLPPVSTGGGPKHFDIGGSHQFQTTEITNDFLESITKEYATAEVKEKAIAWIKGFASGVMFAGSIAGGPLGGLIGGGAGAAAAGAAGSTCPLCNAIINAVSSICPACGAALKAAQ